MLNNVAAWRLYIPGYVSKRRGMPGNGIYVHVFVLGGAMVSSILSGVTQVTLVRLG